MVAWSIKLCTHYFCSLYSIFENAIGIEAIYFIDIVLSEKE